MKRNNIRLMVYGLLATSVLTIGLTSIVNANNIKEEKQVEKTSVDKVKETTNNNTNNKTNNKEDVNLVEQTDLIDKYKFSEWATKDVLEAEKLSLIPKGEKDLTTNVDRKYLAKSLLYFYIQYNDNFLDKGITFKDIEDEEVLMSVSLGLIKGTHTNLFSPDKEIRRQDLFFAIDNLMDKVDLKLPYLIEEINFNDKLDIEEDNYSSTQKLYKLNLITADENMNINPNGAVKKEELIALLNKLNQEIKLINLQEVKTSNNL